MEDAVRVSEEEIQQERIPRETDLLKELRQNVRNFIMACHTSPPEKWYGLTQKFGMDYANWESENWEDLGEGEEG